VIGSLRGTVLARAATTNGAGGEVLLEAGAVGYRVTVPTQALSLAEPGSALFVHVHTHVRDDALVLYGFATRDERDAFEALLGVHSVGPALALALLSTHPPAVLRRIVANEDAEALVLVPGVGRKTANRLLLELKASLASPDGAELSVVGARQPGDVGTEAPAQVRAALAGLGYGADEIREAVRELPGDGEVADLLRAALRTLAAAR